MVEFGDKYYDNKEVKTNTENGVEDSEYISLEEIKWIDFWYEKIIKNPDFVSNLNNQYEWDKSLTWIIAHNEQIQSLLDDILSNYWNYIKQDESVLKKIIEKKKNHENNSNVWQWEFVECFEEFLLNNDSKEWFEEFLLSNWCIRDVILSYLKNYINKNDWKLNTNLISKNNIKAKIKAEWIKKLYMNYNEKYNLEPNDKLVKMVNFWESVKNTVDGIISNYLNKWLWDKEFLESLEWLIWRGKDNETIKKAIESDPNAMDKFNFLLRSSIKEYSRLLDIWNENRTLKRTGDNVFDTQLRAYLFLYWKIFYPDKFESNWWSLVSYEWELWKILEAILVADWKLDDPGNSWKTGNKYIQSEERFQYKMRNRDTYTRKNARRRIWRERLSNKNRILNFNNVENRNLDIQKASWVEIAHEMNLWKSLNEFKIRDFQSNSDMIFRGRAAFRKTCIDFLSTNWEDLSKFDLRIADFFYFDNNNFGISFNNTKLKELKNKFSEPDVNKIKYLLNQFTSVFNNNLKLINQNMNNIKESEYSIVKEHAIWAVVDNIKDMFQNIVKTSNEWDFLSWFEFDEKNSARIENNNLIISGKFNWKFLILKYDLNSGELYMNSYISKVGNDTMIIWDNSPKQKIWELKPFQEVLDDFYKNPTESLSDDIFSKFRNAPPSWSKSEENSDGSAPSPQRSRRRDFRAWKRMIEEHKHRFQEMCGAKIDEINWKIRNEVKTKAIHESAVSDLLKTLNIIPEDNNFNKTINLKSNSDLFRIVQTITNSENSDVSYFSKFLWILMKYVWLSWWRNNLLWQDKTTNEAKTIFDKETSGEIIKYLKSKTENFNAEYNNIDGKVVFDSGQYFWILNIFNENFSEGEPPEWKLKKDKIEFFQWEFMKELEINEQQERIDDERRLKERNDNITKNDEKDPDERLNEQLSLFT